MQELLDFFITNGISTVCADLQARNDPYSDHSPVIATISTSVAVRQPLPRLHTSQTTWETYRDPVRDKVHLAIGLKEREDVEVTIDNFISILQQAAQEATPLWNTQRATIYTPSAINPLNTKRRLLYLKTQFVPRSKHFSSRL